MILDTTVLVTAERSRSRVRDLLDDDDVVIAAITAAELLVGVELADTRNRERRSALVDELLGAIPIVEYDLAVARAHADLLAHVRRTGRPRGAHDLLIAATAKATNRQLLSDDATAFLDLPGVSLRT